MIVACVEWGDYCGRGAEYVAKLASMVSRNLAEGYELVILTDDPGRSLGVDARIVKLEPGLDGWWNKVCLFRPGVFPAGERVLYLDLDVAITGDLAALFGRKGIIHLTDWGWKTFSYGTGVMVWDAGEHEEVWARFTPTVAERLRGDQDWVTMLGGWQALSPVLLRSYRYHAKDGPPPGCAVVSFHGAPKPHDLPPGHWVHGYWR